MNNFKKLTVLMKLNNYNINGKSTILKLYVYEKVKIMVQIFGR